MANSIISQADKNEISKRIFCDRVKILHDYLLSTTLPALFLCSTLIFLGLYHSQNKFLVLTWYLLTIAICILRIILLRWYKRDPGHNALHLKLFVLGATLSGIMWGFAGTLLVSQANILLKVFVIIIIAGLNAGGCQTLKASRAANFLFIITSILPLAISMLFLKQIIYTYLSLALFGYLVFMLSLANKSYKQFINSLQLHYENENLLKQLVIQHSQLKKINQELNEEIVGHEKAKNQLRYMASHDFLTGVDNRLSFDTQFGKQLACAKSQTDELCVMFVDIDHFKKINDNYGHDIGDLALIEVSKLLKRNLREQDSLIRLGGDEFIILMSAKKAKKLAEEFCQRVSKAFANHLTLNGHTLFLSVSIGSSFFPENGDTKQILLKKADLALYRAKSSGRNRYEFYKEGIKVVE